MMSASNFELYEGMPVYNIHMTIVRNATVILGIVVNYVPSIISNIVNKNVPFMCGEPEGKAGHTKFKQVPIKFTHRCT